MYCASRLGVEVWVFPLCLKLTDLSSESSFGELVSQVILYEQRSVSLRTIYLMVGGRFLWSVIGLLASENRC